MFWNAPDNCKAHGRLYEPINFSWVRNGSALSQKSSGVVPALSGSACSRAHELNRVFPVLRPPDSCSRGSLDMMARSNPSQISLLLPKTSPLVVQLLLGRSAADGLMS